ncbi:helix-turn-helix domain-containing protein [Streptomyces sp. NBC_01142]|uniref:AraC-like ligand-binding domain-containing protein n=1 Tax=Streptomyces sp. NBC_01142 TaxID=2975865 RepID=UPI00225A899D|nr:helix-turn-helix domain-containing protein [Streptomyces sp. NBC_01142]MCX4821471.1 helix-turn-helix domain-containing protein [Streptomyces sp. NBC_01142]
MAYAELDTAGLPPEHRFEWWREAVGQGVAPTRISSDCGPDFAGSAGFLTLGPVQVTTMAFSPLKSERPAQLVRRSDPQTFELTLILEGAMRVAQNRRETHLSAGDFAMWTSSRPYSGRAMESPEGGVSRAVILHLPHALVPLPQNRIGELFARGLPAASGVGRILAQYLGSLVQEGPGLDESSSERLGALSLDLATGFLAERIGAQERLPPETRHQLLLAAIDTFIDDNLSDPRLNPDAVAARHNISVRLLHQLFRSRPETVSASIRRRRLERCHADLAAPALRTLPVRAVAARWGLVDAAVFSRAFHAAYAITPGEHRNATLRATGALRADGQDPAPDGGHRPADHPRPPRDIGC